jgi:predicted membrane metal-binding protein
VIYYISGQKAGLKLYLTLYIFTGILILGACRYSPPSEFPFKYKLYKESINVYCKVKDINLSGGTELRFSIITDSLQHQDRSIIYKGKFICVINDDSGKSNLLPGYDISFNGIYYRGKGTRNPGEFNYEEYLNRNEVRGYFYTQQSGIRILNKTEEPLSNMIYQVREYISDTIDKFHSPETSALLKGLLLADRSDIELSQGG